MPLDIKKPEEFFDPLIKKANKGIIDEKEKRILNDRLLLFPIFTKKLNQKGKEALSQ